MKFQKLLDVYLDDVMELNSRSKMIHFGVESDEIPLLTSTQQKIIKLDKVVYKLTSDRCYSLKSELIPKKYFRAKNPETTKILLLPDLKFQKSQIFISSYDYISVEEKGIRIISNILFRNKKGLFMDQGTKIGTAFKLAPGD